MSSFGKSAISSLKWSAAGSYAKAIFQLIQIAILARLLPTEAFGLLALAMFVINFTNMFVEMGFTSAIIHTQNVTNQQYNSLFWFNIVISLVFYSVILLSTPLIANFYNEVELLSILPILSLNLLIQSSGKIHYSILQKDLKFRLITIIDLFTTFISMILAIIFAINGFGVMSIIYATLVSSLFSSLLCYFFNEKHSVKLSFRVRDIIPFLKVGSYSLGGRILSFFTTDIDILLIGKFLGAEVLGLYSLVKQLVLKLFFLLSPVVSNVLSPLLASIQQESTKLKQYYLSVVEIVSNINVPVYLLMAFFGRDILRIAYGEYYMNGEMIVVYLAILYCLNSISNPVGSLQIATGRTDLGFIWSLISLIITPIVIYIGAMHSVEIVALLRATLGILMIVPLWFIQLKPLIDIKLMEYVYQFYKPVTFFLLISALVLNPKMIVYTHTESIFSMVLKLIIIIIVYLIFAYVFNRDASTKSIFMIKKLLKYN